MKRGVKKVGIVLIPLCIIVLSAVGILVGRKLIGTRILHYKQYIIPSVGRVISSQNSTVRIKFKVLDEEELSEMAQESNIRNVLITTETGEQIEAKEWKIENNSSKELYELRTLSITLPTETESFTVKELTIVYPDVKETFDVGNLMVCPIKRPVWIQIWAMPDNLTPDSGNPFEEIDQEPLYHALNATAVYVNGRLSSGAHTIIRKIDFGIPGFGICPDTIRLEQGENVEGPRNMVTFMAQPENEIYLSSESVESLSDQEINLELTEPTFTMWAKVQLSEEFNDRMVNVYFCPLYYCIDPDTQEEVIYGNYDFYDPAPVILWGIGRITNEEEILPIIQEFGK